MEDVPDWEAWQVAETVVDPRELFILWLIHEQFCSQTHQFTIQYGQELAAEDTVRRLAERGFLRLIDDRLSLTDLGERAVLRLEEAGVEETAVQQQGKIALASLAPTGTEGWTTTKPWHRQSIQIVDPVEVLEVPRTFSWYASDDERWHAEADYNPDIATSLRTAYQLLAKDHNTVGAYLMAYDSVSAHFDATMSGQQRLRILFVAALALAANNPPSPALPIIDEALELALALDVEQAQEDLLFLRAAVNHSILQVPDAVEDSRLCLDLITELSVTRELTPTELDTQLEAYLQLAQSEFLLGHYDRTEQLLDQAAALIPRVQDNVKAPSMVAWTRALLLRWRGQYELALTQAMDAADDYTRYGPPGMASRIQGVVGEIALDLAERCQHNEKPLAVAAFLAVAEPYIVRAVELAAASDYGSSETMALITRARLSLLRGEEQDRTALLEMLAQRAAEYQDMAVVAQAYTQLGREKEAMGDIPVAKHWYQRALAVLKEFQTEALGIWAQRALWRLSGEMQAKPEG